MPMVGLRGMRCGLISLESSASCVWAGIGGTFIHSHSLSFKSPFSARQDVWIDTAATGGKGHCKNSVCLELTLVEDCCPLLDCIDMTTLPALWCHLMAEEVSDRVTLVSE